MQRLFSMFPKGAPGLALALIRVALGLSFAEEHWMAPGAFDQRWMLVGSAIVAAGLCAGLLTPVMCALCVILEVATWTTSSLTWQEIHFCIVLDAIALALLGPGAYSLDGRAFGRRKVIFPADPPGRR